MTNKPPKLAQRLLLRFLRGDLAEEVLGDLDEKFYVTVRNKSLFRAKLNYWYQFYNYIRPFAIRKSKYVQLNDHAMFQHYLKIGFRNLLRDKAFSLINILSLAVGMGVCLTICQYLYFELSYDKFHDNFYK